MMRFSEICLYLILFLLFTIPSEISTTPEPVPEDPTSDTIANDVGSPTTLRPADKYLKMGEKFGFIGRCPPIPPTVRGGFYYKLSKALHKHTAKYLNETYPMTWRQVSLTLLDYVPAALAYPGETGETVTNHYFVGQFMSKECGRARLTDHAQAKLQNNLTQLAVAFANEFNEPQMVVPLFVMLPQKRIVETTTPVSVETTTPVSATNVSVSATNVSVSATNVSVSATNVSVGNDSLTDSETMGDYGKETELNEVLLAGLIGEAHFLEGFAPGVHMFIQKGALNFEDIGSWVERIEINTENDTK